MLEMCDNIEDIIYEDYKENTELNIKWYQVIVKTSSNNFRIYLGMLHSTKNISVNYMSINEDMLEAMINNRGDNYDKNINER